MVSESREILERNYTRLVEEHKLSSERQIILITGTFMTRNWEAHTVKLSASGLGVAGGMGILGLVGGRGQLSVENLYTRSPGFSTGHQHPRGQEDAPPMAILTEGASPVQQGPGTLLDTLFPTLAPFQ